MSSKLRSTLAHIQNEREQALLAAIGRHQSFLDTQISTDKESSATERNRIAHREYIAWTNVNLMYRPDGSVRIVIVPHSGTALEQEASKVLEERFQDLGETVRDLVDSFFGATPTHHQGGRQT
jgi:RNase P protein component